MNSFLPYSTFLGLRMAAFAAILCLTAVPLASQGRADDLKRVTVIEAQRAEIVDDVFATGTVVAREETPVLPERDGSIIRAVYVEEGDQVEAQQPLAQLDNTDDELRLARNDTELARTKHVISQERAKVKKAEITRDEAEADLRRHRALVGKGAVSQKAADEAEYLAASAAADLDLAVQSLRTAEAEYELIVKERAQIEHAIRQSTVRAPAAGMVIIRNALVGQTGAVAGAPLFVLAENGEIELQIDVPEAGLVRIEVGQRAEFQILGQTRRFTGTVRRRAVRIDPVTRIGQVRVSLDDSSGVIVGSFVSGAIRIETREGILLPVTALHQSVQTSTVTVVEQNVALRRNVREGQRRNGFVEIVEGIEEGDIVVLKAASFLKDREKVVSVFAETGVHVPPPPPSDVLSLNAARDQKSR